MKKVLKKAKKAIITSLALLIAITGIAVSKPIQANAASYNCMHTTVRVFWRQSSWDLFVHFKDYCPRCGTVFGQGTTPGGFLFNFNQNPGITVIK